MPPMVKSTPMAILSPRDRGMVNCRPKTEIFRAGARFSSAAVIVNGWPVLGLDNVILRKPRPPFRFRAIVKTANMRAGKAYCEKPLREKVSEKCEMLLCKAETGLL